MEVFKDFVFLGRHEECKHVANALGLTQSFFKRATCLEHLRGLKASTTIILVGTYWFNWVEDRGDLDRTLNDLWHRGIKLLEVESKL